MALATLLSDQCPAKMTLRASGLTKISTQAVDMARSHLRAGNPLAYARVLAGEHRSVATRHQQSIEAVIASDGQERLFTRHPANGCLLAKED